MVYLIVFKYFGVGSNVPSIREFRQVEEFDLFWQLFKHFLKSGEVEDWMLDWQMSESRLNFSKLFKCLHLAARSKSSHYFHLIFKLNTYFGEICIFLYSFIHKSWGRDWICAPCLRSWSHNYQTMRKSQIWDFKLLVV